MDLFGDIGFFGYVVAAALPAIILGVREKSRKYYFIGISLIFVYMALESKPAAAAYLVGYILYQYFLIIFYQGVLQTRGRKKHEFHIALALSLAPLVIYKVGAHYWHLKIFAFIGISYMTFKALQIIIESYDGLIEKTNFGNYLGFMLNFSTILSGPIDRSRRFDEDLNRIIPKDDYLEMVGLGIYKILKGMVYKFVLAAGAYQAMTWLGNASTFKGNLIYMYSYGAYLFFDFAGYSLMAIGTGYLFGIETPENFNAPFISKNIKEFWDRWHITLSHWFRDFLYSRLMMDAIKSRRFKSKLLMSCGGFIINMTVMGIWHGLDSYYILYGFYHGVLLALNEVYEKKCPFYKKHRKETWYIWVSRFVTLNLVMFGFFIFSGRLMKII